MSSLVDPASPSMGADGAPDLAARLAALDPHALPPEVVQQLMTTAVRAYSGLVERGIEASPLADRSPVTATDAMRAASGILKALDLETFELALWQMCSGGSPSRDPFDGGSR